MSRKPRSRARPPIATRRAGRESAQSFRHSSGPMPAGSPEVRAMSGLAFLKPQLDVDLVAQLAQPFLVGLLGLPLAQRHARLQAPALRAHVGRAALEHLDEVVAEGR